MIRDHTSPSHPARAVLVLVFRFVEVFVFLARLLLQQASSEQHVVVRATQSFVKEELIENIKKRKTNRGSGGLNLYTIRKQNKRNMKKTSAVKLTKVKK